MYSHHGKTRTIRHNLQIASVLSLVAGLVNVTGFLHIAQLTTNVTGHFALFINDVYRGDYSGEIRYLGFILSFLSGAFFSNLLLEWNRKYRRRYIYLIPVLFETALLFLVPLLEYVRFQAGQDMMANMLLFAMGLQNSYVTRISGAIVRTTHLTGLFTDLGIDISQMFFPRFYPNRKRILAHIRLRLQIIGFFFLGGIIGGILYFNLGMGINTLFAGGLILVSSLMYDIRLTNRRRKRST